MKKFFLILLFTGSLVGLQAQDFFFTPSVGAYGNLQFMFSGQENALGKFTYPVVMTQIGYYFSEGFSLGLNLGLTTSWSNLLSNHFPLGSIYWEMKISEDAAIGLDLGIIPAINLILGPHAFKLGFFPYFDTGDLLFTYGYRFEW